MRSAAAILVFSLLIIPCTIAQAKTSGFLPEQSELFEQALTSVGLTPEDVRISPEDLGLWGGGKYELSVHQFLMDNPWKTSGYTRSLAGGLQKNIDNWPALITSAHGKLDCGVRLGLTGDALASQKARIAELGDNALAVALSELTGMRPEYYSGVALDPAVSVPVELPAPDREMTTPMYYAELPREVRDAAALILFTVPEALRYRDLGLVQPLLDLGLDPSEVYQRVYDYTVSTFEEEDNTTGNEVIDDLADTLLIESLLDHVDWNLLNTGAMLLAVALQDAQAMLTVDAEGNPLDLTQAAYQFVVRTPLGVVSLTGVGNDSLGGDDYLLVLDTAGDETYDCGLAATRDFAHPVSLCLNTAGDDQYRMYRPDQPSNGAGIFGYGYLVDTAGDDEYFSSYTGQGAGIFGTGVLCDLDGDDTYNSYGNSQGSAAFGAGLLIDKAGDDHYDIYKYGQGYGYTRGCGMLIDGGGDDHYYANLEDHFNGGLYGANHHVHFVQGSAFGRRADFTDGHSWAGGCGLLVDGGGDDLYEADCYGQGNAYWYSVGIIADQGGNDVYHAGQYSQGSAPHFAIGILQDEGGDDRYVIGIRQSMGHGRDWSLAWFEDAAGNDWYQGARTTLGVSHVNAISVFWDRHGDDVYLGKGPCFGQSETEVSGSPRDWLLTLGLFVDGGGADRYYLLPGDESYEGSNTFSGEITDLTALEAHPLATDGTSWVGTPSAPEAPGYVGAGVDR